MSNTNGHEDERTDDESIIPASRRSVLQGIGAAGLGGGLIGPVQAQDSDQSGESDDDVPIAIQLYTLRELDASTAELVRMADAAGYDAVEFAGVDDQEAVAAAMEETGMEVAGAHIGLEQMEDSFEETVDTYTSLGADTFTVAFIGPESFDSRESVLQLAERFNAVADRLAEQDLEFAYHNHDHEFVDVEVPDGDGGNGDGDGGGGGDDDGDGDNGENGGNGGNDGDGGNGEDGGQDQPVQAYDVLVQNTNDNVLLEVDVGWVLVGGRSPARLISRYSDRVELIHMKDMLVGPEYEGGGEFAEIGEGDVNMQAVATVSRRAANVDYLIYEHDEPEEPTESLRIGAEYLEQINGPTRLGSTMCTESGVGTEGQEAATNWDNYEKTQLTKLDNAMSMDIAPDGRVFYITRGAYFETTTDGVAEIGVVDPETHEVTTALNLDVYSGQEDGGQGITFDPNFEENGWVYVFYAPRNEVIAETREFGDQPFNRVARFTVEDGTIARDSEVPIIDITTQRETCCHVGGYLTFDADGNLLVSTGDDTNPFESSGFTPIDERDGRKNYDAQRTAGDTSDLRGSILRITPQEDGSYTVPGDNLFTENQGYGEEIEGEEVRPEIYVMGCRNPYTMTVDEATNTLYYADYGPDSPMWNPDRGPVGLVEINQVCNAHYAGWPYVRGANYPYVDYDFETEESVKVFDPTGPVNDSPHSGGLENLPPVRPATIWYPKSWDAYTDPPDYIDLAFGEGEQSFPELPAGGSPMTGPVYRYDESYGENALPEYFDGKHFIMEWGVNYLKYVSYEGDRPTIRNFLPDEEFQSPNDLHVGPDGALYLQEYGPGFDGRGGGIYKIEYTG